MNEVDITVKTTDKTDVNTISAKMRRGFKKVGDDSNNFLGVLGKKWDSSFGKTGVEAGKSLGRSMSKWFVGDGTKLLGKGGQIGGEAFSSGIMGVLKTPVLGPVLMGTLAAVVSTVLPAVGAIAGAGLVTGFGAGIAGLGIMFAAKSDAVGKVWSKTMTGLGSDMQLLSKPFEGTLIHLAGSFQQTVDKFNPVLGKAFAAMAGPIQKFADDGLKALEKFIPAIGPITNAFNGVLGALGPAMISMIGDLSTGMTDLANSVAQNPAALADMVKGLGGLVSMTLAFITTLNDINSGFSTLTGGTSLVTVLFKGLEVAVGMVAAPFQALGWALAGVNALLGKTGGDSANAGSSMLDAAGKTTALAGAIGGAATAAQHMTPAQQAATQAVADAAKKAADAKKQFEDYISAMFRLQDLSLGLSGAQINLQAAIDNASKAVAANGRATDINTEAGRANKTALDAVAQSTNAQTEAMQRSKKGNAAAGKAAEASRATFINLARQMGWSSAAANKMADDMIAIPNVLRIAKLEGDKKDLDGKLAAARKALADPKLTARKRAKLEAEIAQLLAAKRQAQAAIDSLSGKTVDIRINTYKNMIQTTIPGGSGVRVPNRAGGGIRGFAGGGNPQPGRFLVGEEGPEFLDLSGGVGRVTPASNTRQQMRGMGGAVKVVLEFAGGRSSFEDLLITFLKDHVRVRGGGNVQAALGRGA